MFAEHRWPVISWSGFPSALSAALRPVLAVALLSIMIGLIALDARAADSDAGADAALQAASTAPHARRRKRRATATAIRCKR